MKDSIIGNGILFTVLLILSFVARDLVFGFYSRHHANRHARSKALTGSCPRITVHKNTIIKTKESTSNGAKLLHKIPDIKSARECYSRCCQRALCDIGVMKYIKEEDEDGDEIVSKMCFLFHCGYPSKCSFLNHTNYAVIQLHREESQSKVKDEGKIEKKTSDNTNSDVPSSESETEKCPPGAPTALCVADPCDGAICAGHHSAKCIPSYCGSCHPVFYNQAGEKMKCQAKPKPTPTTTTTSQIIDTTVAVQSIAEDKNDVDSSNTDEEDVEIRPEDTSGKPTEEPDYKDATEDPHKVKQWRTWLDSQGGLSPTEPTDVTGLPTKVVVQDQKVEEHEKEDSSPTVIIEKLTIVKKAFPFSLPLIIAMIFAILILIGVIWKLKCGGPKKRKKFPVNDDGDYLINGMYL